MKVAINARGQYQFGDKVLVYNSDKPFLARKPKGWTSGYDGNIACLHRDLSVCDDCATKYGNVYEVYSQHYWAIDLADLQDVIEQIVGNMEQMEMEGA
jgi:hypothetical protein